MVIVAEAGSGVGSAEAERDSLVKLHRDIRKNDTVRSSPVELEGFGDAYAVTHDQPTLHTLTVIGEVEGGTVVSVTATAPRPLFDELQLERSLGSLAAKA